MGRHSRPSAIAFPRQEPLPLQRQHSLTPSKERIRYELPPLPQQQRQLTAQRQFHQKIGFGALRLLSALEMTVRRRRRQRRRQRRSGILRGARVAMRPMMLVGVGRNCLCSHLLAGRREAETGRLLRGGGGAAAVSQIGNDCCRQRQCRRVAQRSYHSQQQRPIPRAGSSGAD